MDTDHLQPIPKQRYYDQQPLAVEDFKRERNFHIAYRQLQNQLLLTPGILTGLTVQKGTTPGQVQITPGVAIDNSGRVINLNLTDSAKFNGTKIPVQSGQFSLDLSDRQYHNNKLLLTLEYNQEEDPSTPDQLKEIPKIGLIPSTDRAKNGQIALATLNVTTSQTGATSSISIEIDPSISVKAVIAPERIPTLKVDQIPELDANKITSGTLKVEQIPDLPASKITGVFTPEGTSVFTNDSQTFELHVGRISVYHVVSAPCINTDSLSICKNGSSGSRVKIV